MAKRELSGTLKNLKFMQRAAQREENAKKVEEDEVLQEASFPSSSAPKKCVVIMEGDPHPGANRGRMSFLSFNPSLDKLNEEASDFHQREASATCSGRQSEITANRENVIPPNASDNLKPDGSSIGLNGELKRKQADEASEALYPNKSQKNIQDQKSSSSNSRSSQKQSKRERLDWNVLRPPKHHNSKH